MWRDLVFSELEGPGMSGRIRDSAAKCEISIGSTTGQILIGLEAYHGNGPHQPGGGKIILLSPILRPALIS